MPRSFRASSYALPFILSATKRRTDWMYKRLSGVNIGLGLELCLAGTAMRSMQIKFALECMLIAIFVLDGVWVTLEEQKTCFGAFQALDMVHVRLEEKVDSRQIRSSG
ncbi:hypothetical protein HOY80DRAFT_1035768 [Tuber brumale]|nr:hypothetical protein HOY80DRAFT_1035768 [Tuber brumale]